MRTVCVDETRLRRKPESAFEASGRRKAAAVDCFTGASSVELNGRCANTLHPAANSVLGGLMSPSRWKMEFGRRLHGGISTEHNPRRLTSVLCFPPPKLRFPV